MPLISSAPAIKISLYSRVDDLSAAMLMLMGGKGNISVTANIAPRLMHELCQAAMSDDVVKTRAIQYQLLAVHKAMFTEANPIPVKWALHEMGKVTAEFVCL